ncbi:PAAR domain-containing protein [Pseudomonas sp. TCU-HL1]|uniref:PAAR domain-containing protein n=1 Tax=Pseudomonas sp. TCU-HL1 TaxID=1856685 RepID=UPI0039C99191
MMFGIAHSRVGDRVTCGKDGKTYQIIGGVSYIRSHGRLVAGPLDSISSCPCKARLIPSMFEATYSSESSKPQPQREATAPLTADSINTPSSSPRSVAPDFAKTFAQTLAITDSETGQPLANREFIAVVEAVKRSA